MHQPLTILSDFIEGTFGFVAYNNLTNDIVVAFRGSDNSANWVEDGDSAFKAYPYGPQGAQVHSGFFDAYYSLSSQVIPAVQGYLNEHNDATIIVTGHSLGAAMSTFAALDIKQKIMVNNTFRFYSYGSPRTGNQEFSDYIFSMYPNGSYKRVVHYNDIVPHLPITEMGFNHAGDEIFYNS